MGIKKLSFYYNYIMIDNSTLTCFFNDANVHIFRMASIFHRITPLNLSIISKDKNNNTRIAGSSD